MAVHRVKMPSIYKKKSSKEDGTIKTVAKSLDANSKTIHAAVQSTKMLASTSFQDVANVTAASVPLVLKHLLLKPTEFVGTNLSYVLDYLLVSAVTAGVAYYYLN